MKRTNYLTGLAAEALCRLALRLKGYRFVASRYKSPLGEINIIARCGNSIALVEVKARPDYATAAEALQWHQRERLSRAANDFLARHPHFSRHYMRFDVMLVTPWRWPAHIVKAWESYT